MIFYFLFFTVILPTILKLMASFRLINGLFFILCAVQAVGMLSIAIPVLLAVLSRY